MVSHRTELVGAGADAAPAGGPTTARLGLERGQLTDSPGFYRRSWRQFRTNRVAVAALAVFAVIVVFVLAAGAIARLTGHGLEEPDLPHKLSAPGQNGFLLGSDALGRDLLVRLAYGGRISLLVAGVAGVGTLLIGAVLGAVSGFFGGWVDTVLMRLVDVLLTIPGFSLLLLIFSIYSPPPIGIALVLAVLSWGGIARIVRGEVLSLRSREYVAASRLVGATNGRIILRHILPNVLPTLLVWTSLAIPGLILAEATLSFLGFGVRVPTPSWGNMLQDARDYYVLSPSNAFIPGAMIYVTVLCTNLIGDALRDAFDPRLNR